MGKSVAKNLVAVWDSGAKTIEETMMNTIPRETVPAGLTCGFGGEASLMDWVTLLTWTLL